MGLKFRCERDVLAKALADAGRAVTTRGGALPVLAGVRLIVSGDQLTITGSDLDLTISVTIEVAGVEDGVAVLPSKLVSDVVRSLRAGGVEITVEDDDARIVAAPSEFAIRVIPADEFPELSDPEGDAVTLDAVAFKAAIEQVEKAASSDDARPILTGVLMAAEQDGLRLVSTDSYRLSVRDLAGTTVLGEGQKVLVPSRALKELARVVGDEDSQITLRLGERDAGFQVGSVSITTRLIEGEFPNYRGLIPTNHPNQLTVDRLTLLDAVRRVRLLAQESTPIRLAMSADGLELVAVTQDVGQAHEAVDEAIYKGDDLTVAFNPEYLIDGIEVAPGDEITLETVDELKPALLKSAQDPDFLYLLMPVRVS
jgi:DNA polymerase III subunit beta